MKLQDFRMQKVFFKQLIKILWIIQKYLLTKLEISDIHHLDDEIVKLENIWEAE